MKYTLPLQDELHVIEKIFSNETCHYADKVEETNELAKALVGAILAVSKANLPYKRYNKHAKPYWRYEKDALNEAYSSLRHAYRQWKNTGRPRMPDSSIFSEYKNAKNNFRRLQRNAQAQYEDDMMQELENEKTVDSNFLWYLVRRATKQNGAPVVNPIVNDTGVLLTKTDEILEEWAGYYNNLLTKPVSHPWSQTSRDSSTKKT